MCMVDGADAPDIWCEREVEARKDHRCGECGRIILKGEVYWAHSGIAEHSGFGGKTCSHCHIMMDWLGEECGGWMYHSVIEDILEHARDYRRPDLARLAIAARRQWKRFKPDRFAFPGRPLPQLPRGLKLGDAQ